MSLLSMLGGGGATPCSSAGCAADATHALHWRNPRIHPVERVKTWAACDRHRETLAAWLRTRGFPVVETAFGETVERVA
ncbi:hypothetical protein [Agrococcus beijingensis]|uniref:hypothetical protein n=1 Tax=Agrococcus beijingensis TaxID=3068634 RepID=UPI002741CBE1|nr:hypothetical protein [Agrococcus sp. REN33]